MSSAGKNILLVIPSLIVSRGLERIFSDVSDFEIIGILSDLSRPSEIKIKNMEPDIIIIDPVIYDFASRHDGRAQLSQLCDAVVIAMPSSQFDEDTLKQYDETLSLYDEPAVIIKKIRNASESKQDNTKNTDEELSAREKEILICVAKGMLNKEIADKFSISIYTVITHRKNITRKTGIKTVAGLTVFALLNNLIDISSFE